MSKSFNETLQLVLKASQPTKGECRNDGDDGLKTFNRDNTRSTSGKPKCWNCGKVGHIAKACRGPNNAAGGGQQSKPESTNPKEFCGNTAGRQVLGEERPDLMFAKLVVNGIKTKGLIDCGSTITILREDMADELGIRINNHYFGSQVRGVTGDTLYP
jgi:hypothetical protein